MPKLDQSPVLLNNYKEDIFSQLPHQHSHHLSRTPTDPLKVRTCNPRLVPKVHHNRPVTKERIRTVLQRTKRIDILGTERILRNLAMLSAQIADLAGLGGASITGRIFAAAVGIEVGKCFGAVAIAGDGVNVKVVDCTSC